MLGATGLALLAQLGVGHQVVAEGVEGSHVGGVAEVEGGLPEGAAHQLKRGVHGAQVEGTQGGRIGGAQHAGLGEQGRQDAFVGHGFGHQQVFKQLVHVHGHVFHAAEVEHAQGAAVVGAHQEIAGVRVGVQLVQLVELELVEVPQRLAQLVTDFLAGIGGQKLFQVLARQPVHGENAGRGVFGVVGRKLQIIQPLALGCYFLAPAQLQGIVGFFEQAGFHFFQVGAHLGFAQAHYAQGNGFHEANVGLDAVGHAGVLHLHGQRLAVFLGKMHLPDAGRLPGFGLKGIEKLVGRFAECIAESLGYQGAGEGRGRVLGLGKLVGVGRGEHVFFHGQHLGHFQYRAFHFAQRAVELGGVGGVQVLGGRLGSHGLFGVVLYVIGAYVKAGFGEAGGTSHLGGWDVT